MAPAKSPSAASAHPGWDPAPGDRQRWLMLAVGSLGFLLSMFHRVSFAVISAELAQELDLDRLQMGEVSAAFFWAFALGQVPVGLALDRVGPRRSMTILAVAAVAGLTLFALAQTPGQLMAGRALLGLGMAANFMGLLAILAAWFPVNRFAFLMGSLSALGVSGNLLAATPLALMSQALGWRTSFLVIAGFNALIAALFFLVARDRPPDAPRPAPSGAALRSGLGRLLALPGFWIISLTTFFRYGFLVALQGLWAAPYLVHGLGFSPLEAANALGCLGLGYMIGLPFCGRLSDRWLSTRKWVVLPGTALYALAILYVSSWTQAPPLWVVMLWFLSLGIGAAPGQISYAHIKELVPPERGGLAMTAINLWTMIGSASLSQVLGLFLAGEPATLAGPRSFAAMWWVGAAGVGLSALLYFFVPESRVIRRGSKP
jgi:MFS family permease